MRNVLILDGEWKDRVAKVKSLSWTSFTNRYPDGKKETYFIERCFPWRDKGINWDFEVAYTVNSKKLKGYLNWKFVRGLTILPAA